MARDNAPTTTLHHYRFKSAIATPTGHHLTIDPTVRYPDDIGADAVLLGTGQYSQVMSSRDKYTGDQVAIKIILTTPKRTKIDFQRELKILTKLATLPSSPIARFCKFLDWFPINDGYCIAFEQYEGTLESVLVDETMPSLATHQVKEISRQLIQGVKYLHEHGIAHGDLNPTNVMFVSLAKTRQTYYGLDDEFHHRNILKKTEIRIIDFGSAGPKGTFRVHDVEERGYSAPEILLYLMPTETIDHFAIGCIICEMLTYKPLFPSFGGGRFETLTIMVRILGPFTDLMRTRMDDLARPLNPDVVRFLRNTKRLDKRIEDPDARRLIVKLTKPDKEKRGDLGVLEKNNFIRIFEL
ncbi:kinase-like domain-containing protein [Mycena metata]|uniref:Kinase-like domain-containing protein n=1 Tax=Mycena metata TaxID=1033252 RepID=A0AAD7HY07_9AGAR|nr:kinase-like domain-containing protein [Mycena metata]